MDRKWLIAILGLFTSQAWCSQDPTAPLNWAAQAQTDVKPKVVRAALPNLQAIVCTDGQTCAATLAGKAVLVGEKINGYRIKSIESDAVILSRGGQQWTLELFSLDVKQ